MYSEECRKRWGGGEFIGVEGGIPLYESMPHLYTRVPIAELNIFHYIYVFLIQLLVSIRSYSKRHPEVFTSGPGSKSEDSEHVT
jgi:hypothetical protein